MTPYSTRILLSLVLASLSFGGCAHKTDPASSEKAPTKPGAVLHEPLPHFYVSGVYKNGDPLQGTDFSDSHGGFGYVSSHSEKRADSLFQFACDPGSVQKYKAQASGPEASQLLYDELFTYLALRAAAMNPSVRPVPIHAPAAGCVSQGSPGQNAINLLPKHSPTDAEILAASDQRLFMEFRSVWSQVKPSALIYALAFDDHLQVQEKFICADPAKEAKCFDLRALRARLEGDFEVFFSRPQGELDGIRMKLLRLIGLVDSIHPLASHAPTPSPIPAPSNAPSPLSSPIPPEDALLTRGREIYKIATETYGDTESFQEGLDLIFKLAGELSSGTGVRGAFKDLLSEGERIWKEYRSGLQAEADGICSLSISEILSKYPNVVRQAIVDSAPGTTLQAELCGEPGLAAARRQESCNGVQGAALPGPTAVTVNSQRPDYPYGSLNAFEITRPTANDPYLIRLQVPLKFDSEFKDTERAEVVSRWNLNANAWYNCQTAQSGTKDFSFNWRYWHPSYPPDTVKINCPTDPKMAGPYPLKFEITLIDATESANPQNVVAVHRCFNADIQSNDCEKVREHMIDKWCGKDAQCAASQPEAGDPRFNRANSGNFISAQRLGTLVHELGHHMGLSDEYADPTYPLNLLGEFYSIMNHSDNAYAHLYARHFDEMLRPLGCFKTSP